MWLIRLAFGAFAVAFVLPALALRSLSLERKKVAAGDRLIYALGDRAGQFVDADDLQPGQAIQAFPEGKTDNANNLIELVRLRSSANGIVAYSAICTHLGCTVLQDLTDEGYILCPCHASEFDPAENARVVRGPARKPLPALPITIAPDGTIVVAGDFSGPVGPQP